MISTKDLKVKFLGITPLLCDETGVLTPQQLVAFSGLLTYSGKSIDSIVKEAKDKGQDIEKKIKVILRKSSLKGHASMSTTPVISFSYEASKFIDSGLTGIVFASAIMASGRRTDTTEEDIVYPVAIAENRQASDIYTEASKKNIDFLNSMLAAGIGKDEASKILQYGIYGTGIIQFPIESLVTLKREYEAEKLWMPEDIGFLITAIEKELKKAGVDLLYATRVAAPRNTYPYPNIFKDPGQTNLAREAGLDRKAGEDFKIISSDFIDSPGLRERLDDLQSDIASAAADRSALKTKWNNLLEKRQLICRDYAMSASIKIFSSTAWRVWGDKKRHRTVPMVVDSVYYSAQVAARLFEGYRGQIKTRSLSPESVDALESVFSIPPAIRANEDLMYGYLDRAADSFGAYTSLVGAGISEKDAIFVIPRGLRLGIVQDYNLYNLIAGYYPLRICSTAEEELRRISIREVVAIKKLLNDKGMDWLARHIVPKCMDVGFCLESPTCGAIKGLVSDYDEIFHKEMHDDLEVKFQDILKEL